MSYHHLYVPLEKLSAAICFFTKVFAWVLGVQAILLLLMSMVVDAPLISLAPHFFKAGVVIVANYVIPRIFKKILLRFR